MSYSHEWHVQRHNFLVPSSGALGRGKKVKYHYISISKSISNRFKQNYVCFITNEKFKTYQTGFSFRHLDHDPGVGLGGYMGFGGHNYFFRNSTKFGV